MAINYRPQALALTLGLLLSGCQSTPTLSMFKPGYQGCYDRSNKPHTLIVDSHNHFRPYGRQALAFDRVAAYLQQSGVLFANIYGIGQTLAPGSDCQYLNLCPFEPVTPSITNDMINAENLLKYQHKNKHKDIHLTLSMSFADLAEPQTIMGQIKRLDQRYPKLFKWVGEVNLVKQALFNHGHTATPIEAITRWQDFMAYLQRRHMPIAIHGDIGNDQQPLKYLPLFDHVLEQYPDNKIVWVHMGLSRQQLNLPTRQHIGLLQQRLDRFPNLTLDISWRILNDHYFNREDERDQYIDFFNRNPTQVISGTDFVASRGKTSRDYRAELNAVSRINQYLNDRAFRHIVLGQNYFELLQLDFQAPKICDHQPPL